MARESASPEPATMSAMLPISPTDRRPQTTRCGGVKRLRGLSGELS
jgi:hypothetical protein